MGILGNGKMSLLGAGDEGVAGGVGHAAYIGRPQGSPLRGKDDGVRGGFPHPRGQQEDHPHPNLPPLKGEGILGLGPGWFEGNYVEGGSVSAPKRGWSHNI